MSTTTPYAPLNPCACHSAAEATTLKNRVAQLTEEIDELKRDKRSFREANDDARKHLVKISHENKELRRRLQVENEERKRGLGEVEKPVICVAVSGSRQEGRVNTDPPLMSPLEGSSISYPSPAESDRALGGEGERERKADQRGEAHAKALGKRQLAEETEPFPSKKANTQAFETHIPPSPLHISPNSVTNFTTESPSLDQSMRSGAVLSDNVSDPRLREKGKHGSRGPFEGRPGASSSAATARAVMPTPTPPSHSAAGELPIQNDRNIQMRTLDLAQHTGAKRVSEMIAIGSHFIGLCATVDPLIPERDEGNRTAYHVELPPTPLVPQQSPPKKGIMSSPMRHGTPTPMARS